MNLKLSIMLLLISAVIKLHASDTSPADVAIVSQEINTINGVLNIKVRVWANVNIYGTAPQAGLPSGWQLSSVTNPSNGGIIAAGDSVDYTFIIVYPSSGLPFFPRSVTLSLLVTEQTATTVAVQVAATSSERVIAKGRIYFTPYNTVEVWSEGDFFNLRRTWFQNDTVGDTTRIFVHARQSPKLIFLQHIR